MRFAERHRLRQRPGLALQGQGAGVARQAVEVGAVEAGESFQSLQRTGGVEDLGVELERAVCGIAARAAAGVFLEVRWGGKYGIIEETMAATGPRWVELLGKMVFNS